MSSFKGGIFILSSPSGAGKLHCKKIAGIKILLYQFHTTRKPRLMKTEKIIILLKNYFKKLIKSDEFLEHAKVFDNYYGSSKKLSTT